MTPRKSLAILSGAFSDEHKGNHLPHSTAGSHTDTFRLTALAPATSCNALHSDGIYGWSITFMEAAYRGTL